MPAPVLYHPTAGITTHPAPAPTHRPRRRPRAGVSGRLDAFFRCNTSRLAQVLGKLSPARGAAYSQSTTKRALDLALAVPAAALAIVLILLLLAVNKLLHPRLPALFVQSRVGHNAGALRIVKIRSMVTSTGGSSGWESTAACTSFGRFIRRHYLDELPQLLQVVTGQLSMVGIRVLPVDVYLGLGGTWSDRRFETWRTAYGEAPLGLTGIHQVFRSGGKQDSRRFHRDLFYARHASLGLDLYLLWRTLGTSESERRAERRILSRPHTPTNSLHTSLDTARRESNHARDEGQTAPYPRAVNS